ncbi:hypothetical protein P4B35_20450 [Pontiellaceae bacterium B12227]|nr:hypothetical protein [Pontiellaceae bacterium B12227]
MKLKQNILFVITAALLAGNGWSEVYITESFTGTSADNWSFTSGSGAGASLTAASGLDSNGDGWLRLTQDAASQSSFVYNNQRLSTAHGLVFEFDFVIWGANSSLADGFTLALFDADATPIAGGTGGSLGYAQHSSQGSVGLNGGIAGFGFDVFGNYSKPTEGRIGGPGYSPSTIAIRGSMGATRSDGYEYITNTGKLDAFATPNASSRDDASVHTVRITIPTDKKISIEWKTEEEETYTTLLDEFQCSLDCPEEVMFGFTGGTGSVSANQEIRNLSVSSIPEPGSMLMIAFTLFGGLWIRRTFLL